MKATLVLAAALLVAAPAFGQERPLIAGFDGTAAPHVMAKPGGGVEGFNIDLILEAGKRMGRKIEIFAGEFSGLIPAMNAGKIDFVGAPTPPTPERAQNMLFSEGYLNLYYVFLLPSGKPDVKSFEDLKGKSVSANKGSSYDRWLQDNAPKYGFTSSSYGSTADAMQTVITGRADAGLLGNTLGAYAVMHSNGQLKAASFTIDQGLVYSAAFRKDDAKLRNAFEQALECMKLDGTVGALAEKWFGSKAVGGPAAVTTFPGYGVPGVAGSDPTPHTPKCS